MHVAFLSRYECAYISNRLEGDYMHVLKQCWASIIFEKKKQKAFHCIIFSNAHWYWPYDWAGGTYPFRSADRGLRVKPHTHRFYLVYSILPYFLCMVCVCIHMHNVSMFIIIIKAFVATFFCNLYMMYLWLKSGFN